MNYGEFTNNLGGYKFNKLPKAGKLEYLYKTKSLLLKVDQYGIQSLQFEAPVGVFALKRELREFSSPLRVCFELNKKVVNNFDILNADSFEIEYTPISAIYTLNFDGLTVKTTLINFQSRSSLLMKLEFVNNTNSNVQLKLLPVCFGYLTSLDQAPWDKADWYTRVRYDKKDKSLINMTHYSPEAKLEDRRYMNVLFSEKLDSVELSLENLISSTKNLSIIPDKMLLDLGNDVYGYEQVISGLKVISIDANSNYDFSMLIDVSNNDNFDKEKAKDYFNNKYVEKEKKIIESEYLHFVQYRSIKTNDSNFDNFVNGFLPLELSWVASLDRGWGTSLRGTRDASNDFMGYLHIDPIEARKVIQTFLSKQRNDGWYPRQVSFNNSDKMDLRAYVDSSCFFFEFVYEYICYTNDFAILDEFYPYYNDPKLETGFEHIKKGVEYLMKPECLGEHGLVKLQGGDWLDCLGGVGKKGRAETVMVSAQMILTIKQFISLASFVRPELDLTKYEEYANQMKKAINKYSYNELGYYSAVFADDGNWYFSPKDIDGFKRVYAPTNCYCLLTGVASGKEKEIIENLESLRTDYGYKLFSEPFGKTRIEGLSKMGTGDFQPYFAENGSVYNHGSQCFYLRALASIGDHKRFADVLKFALPIYRDEEITCSSLYALTNCYQLIPGFTGRTMFSFLTGSIAMIERAIYNWMFGIQFEPKQLIIKPCLPENYKDSNVKLNYLGKKIELHYHGYGSTVLKVDLNGSVIDVHNGAAEVDKSKILDNNILNIYLE